LAGKATREAARDAYSAGHYSGRARGLGGEQPARWGRGRTWRAPPLKDGRQRRWAPEQAGCMLYRSFWGSWWVEARTACPKGLPVPWRREPCRTPRAWAWARVCAQVSEIPCQRCAQACGPTCRHVSPRRCPGNPSTTVRQPLVLTRISEPLPGITTPPTPKFPPLCAAAAYIPRVTPQRGI